MTKLRKAAIWTLGIALFIGAVVALFIVTALNTGANARATVLKMSADDRCGSTKTPSSIAIQWGCPTEFKIMGVGSYPDYAVVTTEVVRKGVLGRETYQFSSRRLLSVYRRYDNGDGEGVTFK
ncbi:MAG: hypothetical protein JST35_07465 [Armatimonadetes bacterium]|nr:hypothetical protein [Armatimonadota bacterium]